MIVKKGYKNKVIWDVANRLQRQGLKVKIDIYKIPIDPDERIDFGIKRN